MSTREDPDLRQKHVCSHLNAVVSYSFLLKSAIQKSCQIKSAIGLPEGSHDNVALLLSHVPVQGAHSEIPFSHSLSQPVHFPPENSKGISFMSRGGGIRCRCISALPISYTYTEIPYSHE